MTLDISAALNDWEFDPEGVAVRTITGDDGRERIQLRLDLGVLQMEINGRPDGKTIQGSESWLDLHSDRQHQHDEANPDGAPYQLQPEDCAELMREGVQYYHRYVSFWSLRRFELCARDTERNLRLFRFVREHARLERDKMQFDQWRPYVIMMHSRAVATPLVELEEYDAALSVIDNGIERVEQFLADYGRQDKADKINELIYLKRWRNEIASLTEESSESEPPAPDPIELLREQLSEAIAGERYEEAAGLRDELHRLEEPPPPFAS